jgi:glutamate dehydrogenase/leucine dehydrogenase
MLKTTQELIIRAGKRINLDDAEIKNLLKINNEYVFDIELDNGQKLHAFRVQHNNKLGPYKGGIRFHPEVDLNESRALATLMSLKTSAMGLPLGGGKGGVAVDPATLSDVELEAVSRQFVRHLHPHIGPDKDIPAPDVNTDSRIIDWMVDEFSQLTGDKSKASFTGKSIKNQGSLGRDAATGRGGVIALAELLRINNDADRQLTVAVQGYGNVGSFFAEVAQVNHPNWKLIAVSDSKTTLVNKSGLDAKKLADFKSKKNSFSKYADSDIKRLPSEDILGLDVDILVLAALGDAVNESNMDKIKATYIVELANGPVDIKAIDYLSKNKVDILPGIIANGGGVAVSYLEWVQNKQNEHWTEDEVNKKLNDYMINAVKDTVRARNEYRASNLIEAAFIVAIKRLIT